MMAKAFTKIIRKVFIYTTVALLVFGFPLSAMAEDAQQPADPNAVPIDTVPELTYTYNSQTGHWDSNRWYYDSTTRTYRPMAEPAAAEQPAVTDSLPVTPTVIFPQADDGVVFDQQGSTAIDSVNQVDTDNTINSLAQSGDAAVAANTNASDAISGDSAAAATLLNNVNSTLSTGGNEKVASFVTDVMGDVKGDIMLQPMLLKAMLEGGSDSSTQDVTVNVKNDTTLTNDINLNATSGDASVIKNTSVGSATTGSADTVANVLNIINSMIAANQSFIGTVNIYGNLEGDILIAPDFIPKLIANNGTAINLEQDSKKISIVDMNDTQSIINNISLAAESGKAAVLNNTSAGSATTGDANTNIVIFNLSGHEIIASNSLLVFVNVLGKWVGVIVDAPSGATAAAIGNGVTTNNTVSPDLVIVSDNNNQIINNIALGSKSGDALVEANTAAGNARSGNATASANIANVTNSQFGLSGWFGVLYINVFGSWYGSFGIDTAYGNQNYNGVSSQTQDDTGQVIKFIPSTERRNSSNVTLITKNENGDYYVSTSEQELEAPKVLGSASSVNNGTGGHPGLADALPRNFNLLLTTGSVVLIAVSIAGLRRFVLAGKDESIAEFPR